MALPKTYFTFTITSDLSLNFLDRSAGFITSYFWDFGFTDEFNNPVTSTQASPQGIVFPTIGKYRVKHTTSNAEGSDLSIQEIEVSDYTPTTGITIYDMFVGQLPRGLAIDLNQFYFLIKKWQLFLKSNYTGNTNEIFIEAYWPDLFRVLISKLIVWDYIINAASATIISLTKSNGGTLTQPNIHTVFIQDYKVELPNPLIFDMGYTLTIDLLLINGEPHSSDILFTDSTQVLEWLQSLDKGTFIYQEIDDRIHLVSLQNSNVLSSFSFTTDNPEINGVNSAFTPYNPHYVDINSTTTIVDNNSLGVPKAGVKKVETGPSQAEWFDISDYWANMFNGDDGSTLGMIKADICMYANNLKLYLSICPKRKTIFLPKNFRKC